MVITNTPPSAAKPNLSLTHLIQRAWQFNKMLTLLIITNVSLLGLGVMGLALDPRMVLNAPVWAKTTKFAISFSVYGGTLLWMLTYLKSRPRAAQFIGAATSTLLLAEMAMIVLQAMRGVPIHFNEATPFDTVVWRVMSIAITAFFFIDIVGAVLLLREKMPDRVLATSIRLGLLVAFIGMALAFAMTEPNATQTAALQAGQKLNMTGAHNVGAMIDGQTRMIPFLGWNMDGGDLRIAHFIGLHGAQIIPLLGFLMMCRKETWLQEGHRVALVWLGALGYSGLTLLTFWQAMRNQSIIAPDLLTLAAFFGLATMVMLAAFGIVAHAKNTVRADSLV
jgi:hypothetical protein